MRRRSILLPILLLAACPQPEDPGRTERVTAPAIRFPTDEPTRAERSRLWILQLVGGNPAQRGWAIRQLARSGEVGVRALERALASPRAASTGFVQNALRALEAIGRPSGAPVAAPWLKDGNPLVRERAADALGACGGPEAVTALIGALDDDRPRVAGRALAALGPLRSPEAGRAVLARRDRWGPGMVAHAAGTLHGEVLREAAPWLRSVARDHRSLGDRVAAAAALLRIEDGAGARALAVSARDAPDPVWGTIVGALLEWNAPEGRALLEAGLASDDPNRRAAAFGVSIARPSSGRYEDVLSALGSKESANRRLAMQHMGEWILAGHRDLEAALLRILADEGEDAWRDLASKELVEVGRPDLLDRLRDELRERPGRGRGEGSRSFGLGRALARAGAAGIDRLSGLLGAENPDTVSGALAGLVAADAREASADVAKVLWHEDRGLRLEAAMVLARIGRRSDLPTMRQAFDRERDRAVRAAVAASARRILDAAEEEE